VLGSTCLIAAFLTGPRKVVSVFCLAFSVCIDICLTSCCWDLLSIHQTYLLDTRAIDTCC